MLDHLFLDTVAALRAALDESLLERALAKTTVWCTTSSPATWSGRRQ